MNKLIKYILVLFLSIPISLFSHSGNTDADGGHWKLNNNNQKIQDSYHFHNSGYWKIDKDYRGQDIEHFLRERGYVKADEDKFDPDAYLAQKGFTPIPVEKEFIRIPIIISCLAGLFTSLAFWTYFSKRNKLSLNPSKNKKIFPSDKQMLLIMISLFIGGIWIGFNWLSSLLLTIIFFTSFCGLAAYLDEKGHLEGGGDIFPAVPMFIILFLSFLLVGGAILDEVEEEPKPRKGKVVFLDELPKNGGAVFIDELP